jgi:hypothetical protein
MTFLFLNHAMRRIAHFILIIVLAFNSNQSLAQFRSQPTYLYATIGMSEKEILNYYSSTKAFEVYPYTTEKGSRELAVKDEYVTLNYLFEEGKCWFVQVMPIRKQYGSEISKMIDSLYRKIEWNVWIVANSPRQYLVKVVTQNNELFVVYDEQLYTMVKNRNKAKGASEVIQDIDMPVYGNDEFYDGYQMVDFAKLVKFKPRNNTLKNWETVIIAVFSNQQGSSGKARQINIEGMYLCHKQSDVMYRRYTQLYGMVSRAVFDKYCRLFVILLKTDDIPSR